eukprot:CAMPEP_0197445252 /NCGR_PEP_ID=MMETSP1175-20131217/10516_1 /TAXON_ID=1003142 /ORGANISM="Triceratium dubium, Strain CCMP147" /LENGTH=119 /DNA_ID=CAMNT_0042976179 /DNA_START=221 /DNA_END=580 /DNA_ORIENTATION=+
MELTAVGVGAAGLKGSEGVGVTAASNLLARKLARGKFCRDLFEDIDMHSPSQLEGTACNPDDYKQGEQGCFFGTQCCQQCPSCGCGPDTICNCFDSGDGGVWQCLNAEYCVFCCSDPGP